LLGELFHIWKQYAHQHPVIAYVRETGDGSAHQISDFLNRRQYHQLELYQECYKKMNVEHQMAVTANAPQDIVIGIALNRSGPRFAESERLLVNMFRPHLVRAYLNLVELSHLQHIADALTAALDDGGIPTVLRSQRGVVLRVSERARDLLEKYFGWSGGKHLPHRLERWVRSRLESSSAPPEIRFSSPVGQLTASLSDRLEFHYSIITLREDWQAPDKNRFESLGLTPRENEVLSWLVEGKSNQEIAVILGLSPLTVKTHLQSILKKMHVENRTTAVARALELLRR
jgi:DNA-binding CsgD family transcriptional regulator